MLRPRQGEVGVEGVSWGGAGEGGEVEAGRAGQHGVPRPQPRHAHAQARLVSGGRVRVVLAGGLQQQQL